MEALVAGDQPTQWQINLRNSPLAAVTKKMFTFMDRVA